MWLNQQYLKTIDLNRIVDLVKQRLHRKQVFFDPDMDMSSIVDVYRQRVATLNELADSILYFFEEFDEYDEKAANKVFKAAALEPLQALFDGLNGVTEWTPETIHQVVHDVTGQLGVNMGKVGQPLRVAVTGGAFSPPIDQTVAMIGRENTLHRIQRAIEYINKKYSVESP